MRKVYAWALISLNTKTIVDAEKPPLTPLRPKVNSIFHLFGEWLFEAALIGTTASYNNQRRAEALGTLCRVLCSKQCREEVLAPYLARCYAALHHGLAPPSSRTAAAAVLNASDIFRLDLDGVLVLVPDFINALDHILTDKEPKMDSVCCLWSRSRTITEDCPCPSSRGAMISGEHGGAGRAAAQRAVPVRAAQRAGTGPRAQCAARLHLVTQHRLQRLYIYISLICVSAVQAESTEALAVPLLSALYLCSGSASGSEGHSLEDFAADVRELDPSSPVFALVVRATYLVCHRLISSWKGDLQVSLAALELLSGLAKLHSVQCGRPPQAHSRDLHSCVVAAYSCLAAWLCPALLADGDCLATLMEVVELGIAGAKSQGNTLARPALVCLAAWLCPALLADGDCLATLMEVVELGIAGAKSQGNTLARPALVCGGRVQLPRRLALSRAAGRRGLSLNWASPAQRAKVTHSRDLHSCVVAAYSCLAAWLCPALLADGDCLATLMEVVELGIAGAKSQGNTLARPALCGRPPQAHSRDLHSCVVAAYSCLAAWLCPALLADGDCLATLMEVVELGIAGAKSQDGNILLSLLEEPLANSQEPQPTLVGKYAAALHRRRQHPAVSARGATRQQPGAAAYARRSHSPTARSRSLRSSVSALRHYIADGNILLSLLEEPLANSQEPQPTLVGKCAAALHRRRQHPAVSARGATRQQPGAAAYARRSHSPTARSRSLRSSVSALRHYIADGNILLSLLEEPLANSQEPQPTLVVLRQLNDAEAPTLFKLLEQQANIEKRARENEDSVVPEEHVPPEPVTEFQTARLFLSNFGVVTAHVFCARSKQDSAHDIVANSRSDALPAGFIHMLRGYDALPLRRAGAPSPAGTPAVYDGREQVLYWSDSTSEIAFVLPSGYELSDPDDPTDSTDADGCGSSRQRQTEQRFHYENTHYLTDLIRIA
ncbi:Ral GTPase-activating protein subunit beta [Operophtera brumata]|uniref:Ral GTPase-activating protein subunit beta n=1 Tax=Operophtera brumata TaxID=104452 RepID=A0A0L7LTD3_OPEBR|nr:Ral GTPase-activating protein subunit beta [Operophtera brumata]